MKVNDACLEMAEHCGCAVVPARVGRPRDRAAAERAVDLCETWALAPLAGERFSSLAELNSEVRGLADALDARPLSRREGCRDDALFGEGRAAPRPPPDAPLEWCERRRCKVSPDYHVQADHMRRSVPRALVGRTLDVRLGASTVAILESGEVVAEHRRLRGRRGRCSTDPSHMPPGRVEARSLRTRAWFGRRAGEVGPEARRLIGAVLDARPVEAQGYVARSNIPSLSGRGRAADLEAACAGINGMGGAATHTRAKNAMSALRGEAARGPSPAASPADPPRDRAASAGRVRGAAHHRRGRGDGDA